MLVMCVYRPEDKHIELSANSKYDVISIEKGEVLINNNLNRVQWYPLHYFKFIWKQRWWQGHPLLLAGIA